MLKQTNKNNLSIVNYIAIKNFKIYLYTFLGLFKVKYLADKFLLTIHGPLKVSSVLQFVFPALKHHTIHSFRACLRLGQQCALGDF